MTNRTKEDPTRQPAAGRIAAVLFDLDGTLIDIDVEGFFPDYFKRLAAWVAPYIPPAEFTPRLMRSTAAMIDNLDSSKTNQEVFFADFFDGLKLRPDELLPVFDAFYREEFPKLARHGRAIDGARGVVETVMASGRPVVVATSPLFPREAIDERLRWAGLADLPFAFVTTYENMHFCKPHSEYYAEVVARLGLRPEECLMVGNDVEEDLPAKDAGLLTYLVDRNLIHRGHREAAPDFRGPLAAVPRVLDGR